MATKKKVQETSRRAPRPKPSRAAYIHEIGTTGLHRIVSLKDNVAVQGQWVPLNQIAVHGRMRAATEHFQGLLPTGLFTTSSFSAARVDG